MRRLILTILLLSAQNVFGQKAQVTFQASSGLFSFGGGSASSSSYMIISDVGSIPNYTNSPYGKNSSLSYGLGIQIQRLAANEFSYGLQLSYESLSSKLVID